MFELVIGGKMRSTGEIIRERRLNKGYTAVKLAEELGVSQSYITAIENNRKSPSDEMIQKLVTLIYLNKDDLAVIGEYEIYRRLPKEVQEKLKSYEKMKKGILEESKLKTHNVKIFGMASAGTGVIDSDEMEVKEIVIPNGLKVHGDDFGIKVHGDSMEPALYNGDLVLVDTTLCSDWRAYNRKIVVIRINEERFIKKVVIKDYKVEFHSLNEFYPPIIPVDGDEVQCVGIVTALLFRDYSKVKF